MKEKGVDLSKLSNSEMWLFLFLLFLEDEKKANSLIKEFENELIYKNRFSSNHPVVSELHKFAPSVTKNIRAGTTFFRARIFRENCIDEMVKYYLCEHGSAEEEIKDILLNWDDENKALLLVQYLYCNQEEKHDLFNDRQALIRAHTKWAKNKRFKGYNATQSTAPKADVVGDGRANPDHIRYLYLCEDQLTPVFEVRAGIGDDVSVAKFKLLKDITIYNLVAEDTQNIKVEGSVPCLFNAIGALFSRPYKQKKESYIATQFLAEEIKRMGYDGVRYASSLHSGGYNIVLFDPSICKPVSSEVIHIKSIEIKTEDAWPLSSEEINNMGNRYNKEYCS